jgi:hypothetical protein
VTLTIAYLGEILEPSIFSGTIEQVIAQATIARGIASFGKREIVGLESKQTVSGKGDKDID